MNKHMYCHSFPIFGKKELVPTGQTPLPHGGVWDTPIGTKQATAIKNKKTKKNSKTCRHLCCSVTQSDVSLVAWERALYGTVLRTAPEIEVSLLFFHLPPHCNWYFSVIIQFWDLTIIVENMIWRDHNFKYGSHIRLRRWKRFRNLANSVAECWPYLNFMILPDHVFY